MDKRFKIAMLKKGVKVQDLARHLNIDPSRASRIVNGWVIPKDDTKKKIAALLGVSIGHLWKIREDQTGQSVAA